MRAFALLAALAAVVPVSVEAAPTIAAMRDHARVLIVAAPTAGDPRLARQRRALASWARGARARDLTMVTLVNDRVDGAADRAAVMRRRWHLPPGDFQVVLLGKDGHEALRTHRPIAAVELQRRIDAMPMRRAGRR